jgi:hypothetical protein
MSLIGRSMTGSPVLAILSTPRLKNDVPESLPKGTRA